MNTHKFFTLATLLAVALGSVAMADTPSVERISGTTSSTKTSIYDTCYIEAASMAVVTNNDKFFVKGLTNEPGTTSITNVSFKLYNEADSGVKTGFSGQDTHGIFTAGMNSGEIHITISTSSDPFYFQNGNNSDSTGGGAFSIVNNDLEMVGNYVLDSNKSSKSNARGGAISITGDLNFTGSQSKGIFTNNTDSYGANDISVNNGNFVINGGLEYSFGGGVYMSSGEMDIIGSPKVSFGSSSKTEVKKANISAGSQVTFSGDATSKSDAIAAELTITDDTTKVVFQGTQEFTQMYIQNGATSEIASTAEFNSTNATVTGQESKVTVAKDATFNNSSFIVDNRGELTIADSFNSPTATITAQNGGVVDLNSTGDFTFKGNLVVDNGGVVNFNGGNTSKLTVEGNLSGSNGDLNLAIQKTATKSMTDGKYDVEGQTLEAINLSGENFITVSAPDFKYHEETGMFAILTSDPGMTLGDFYDAFNLPLAWFASVDKEDFSFINQNLSATGDGTFYIFKVDGDKVPEPSTWALLILGSVGLYFIRRKKTAK